MPSEATFTVKKIWLDDNLVEQIARVAVYIPEVTKQSSGYDYMLDASNDWWLSITGNQVTVAARYASQEKMRTLVLWLEHKFGIVNPE